MLAPYHNNFRKNILTTAIGSLLYLTASVGFAAQPASCNLDFLSPITATEKQPLTATANELEWGGKGSTRFSGDVNMSDGLNQLQAEQVEFNESSTDIFATGNIRLDTPEFSVEGAKIQANIQKNIATIEELKYRLYTYMGHGQADKLELQGLNNLDLEDATYTTCSPQDNTWYLKAQQISFDRKSGWGEANDLTLRLYDVPVMYFPYLSFPIDDRRKSGFLFPMVGINDKRGLEIYTPYYLNLAPDYDATLTPHFMSDRGLQLISELRYLSPNGNGYFDFEFLNDTKLSDQRTLFHWQHDEKLWEDWNFSADYREVSDDNYLHDLKSSNTIGNQNWIRREVELGYKADWWTFNSLLTDYQVLDNSDEPYSQFPAINIQGFYPVNIDTLMWHFDSEFSSFGGNQAVTGDRFDLMGGLSWAKHWSAGSIYPKLSYRTTQYQQRIDEQELDEGESYSRSVTRTLPIASIDNRINFERDLDWRGQSYIQTLEPRLYYLYVPSKEQDDINLYDTTFVTEDYDSLFRENRFLGRDRVGDANQVSLGISTGFIKRSTGVERLRIRVARAYYLENQEITLTPDSEGSTTPNSPIFSNLGLNISDDWSLNFTNAWNTKQQFTEQSAFQLQYRPDEGDKIVNFMHRYRRSDEETTDTIEQIEVSGAWGLGNGWRLFGRWQKDLTEQQTIDSYAGAEYNDCCWGFRVLYRKYLDNSPTDIGLNEEQAFTRSIDIQFSLKGLSDIGTSNILRLVRNSIDGYQDLN